MLRHIEGECAAAKGNVDVFAKNQNVIPTNREGSSN